MDDFKKERKLISPGYCFDKSANKGQAGKNRNRRRARQALKKKLRKQINDSFH